jgi:uncharacterized membrane protein
MKLSVKECLLFGWNIFIQRPWLFVLIPIVAGIIAFVGGIAGAILNGILSVFAGKAAGSLVVFVITAVVNVFLGIGIVTSYLKAHDDVASVKLTDLWNPKPFWRFLATNLLVTLCVVAGLILFVIPGLIVSVMLAFSVYTVIDSGLNPIAALKESMRITKGNRWNLFGLMLSFFVLNLVGVILLVIGLFVTVPISILASVHAYRTLSGGHKAPVETPAEPRTPAPVRAVG